MAKPRTINRDFNKAFKTGSSRKRPHMLYALCATSLLLISVLYFKFASATISAPSTENNPGSSNIIPIALPEPSELDSSQPKLNLPSTANKQQKPAVLLQGTSHPPSLAEADNWSEYTIKSGDNLAKIFKQKNLSANTLHKIIHANTKNNTLKNIKPGQRIRFLQDNQQNFVALEYVIDRVKTLNIRANDTGFHSSLDEKPVKISHLTAAGTINNSLFYDAKQAGLSDRTIMQLANIFGWDIDFAQNLRQGDSFSLLYEAKYIDGQRIENGQILAAEFTNRGETFQAVRFVDNEGHAEYFSPAGKSMRKTFLRNPIDFARVSSHFNLRRKHPVLNRIRAHKGVDYAASTGTPIKSTGDGRIVYRSRKGGYGRVVIIQHGQKYSSLYAHMSKYGRYKKGSYVKQGQVIGYVGKSGLATGPHLHYEFRINGVHRNPLTAKFPSAKPINKKLLAKFKQQAGPLLAQLTLAKETQLALKQ